MSNHKRWGLLILLISAGGMFRLYSSVNDGQNHALVVNETGEKINVKIRWDGGGTKIFGSALFGCKDDEFTLDVGGSYDISWGRGDVCVLRGITVNGFNMDYHSVSGPGSSGTNTNAQRFNGAIGEGTGDIPGRLGLRIGDQLGGVLQTSILAVAANGESLGSSAMQEALRQKQWALSYRYSCEKEDAPINGRCVYEAVISIGKFPWGIYYWDWFNPLHATKGFDQYNYRIDGHWGGSTTPARLY